jgi:Tfp pilus assembly protein FimV
MTAVLLLVVQSLHAGSVTATQPSMSSQAASEPEPVAENGKSQPAPAAEIAPISVPVSDAVKQAAMLMRPAGATLDQVVAAMVILNPAVFGDGDLQHVTFSQPLNVPSTQEILREDPDGLALLLLQLDIVAAASPLAGFNDGAALPQVEDLQHQVAPSQDGMTQAAITAPQKDPYDAGSSIVVNTVWIVPGAALLLISLLWLLFRPGASRGRQPLSTSSKAVNREESSVLQSAQGDQRMPQRYDLPDDYLDYDGVEVLLTRLVSDCPDASRHVLQLMHFFRMRQDRQGFQRQHHILLENGFYQRHAELRSVISEDAASLGVELDWAAAAKVSIAAEERMQMLQQKVAKAEKATRAAEKRAGKAELELRKMQLQLDFGETDNDSR